MPKDPIELNDGTYDYRLVWPTEELEDGRSKAPLYIRLPVEVFTPDLAFVSGQTTVPQMHSLNEL